MRLQRIEVDARNGHGIGAKFAVVDEDGARMELNTVTEATVRIEAGRPVTVALSTVMVPTRATGDGSITVRCQFCDHFHSHSVGGHIQ